MFDPPAAGRLLVDVAGDAGRLPSNEKECGAVADVGVEPNGNDVAAEDPKEGLGEEGTAGG